MSNQWEIDYDGDRRTLKDWGIQSFQFARRNLDADELTLTMRGDDYGTTASIFPYKAKLVLYYGSGSDRRFTGWITARPTLGRAEAHQYVASGPWWWLANTPFKGKRLLSSSGQASMAPALVDSTHLISNYNEDGSLRYGAGLQMARAVNCAIAAGAPIALGTIEANVRAPYDLVKDMPCSEVIRNAARWAVSHVFWWDYYTATPTCHCKARADLSAETVNLIGGQVEDFSFTPRDDLKVYKVKIMFEYPKKGDPNQIAYSSQVAGDNDYPDGPGALLQTITVGSWEEYWDLFSTSFGTPPSIATKVYEALSSLQWEGGITMRHTNAELPQIAPGVVLNATNGVAAWATMNAVVQQTVLTHDPKRRDTLEITVGPPEHLGPQDFFELLSSGQRTSTDQNGAGEKKDGGGGGMGPGAPDEPIFYKDLFDEDAITGSLAALSAQSQVRGGIATIVGHEVFTTPDTPPNKYRKKAWSGSVEFKRTLWNGGACEEPRGGTTDHLTMVQSGECTYGISTGTIDVITGKTRVTNHLAGGAVTDYNKACIDNNYPLSAYGSGPPTTQTQMVATGAECSVNASYTDSNIGSFSTILSQLDTEEDAWGRLEATLPAWGDPTLWPVHEPSKTAYYNVRTGYTFGRREMKMRFSAASGLTPFWTYYVTIQYARTNFATGITNYDFQTVQYSEIAGVSGDLEILVDVPNERGYQTWPYTITYSAGL